jgi:hypothetical protein
MIGFAFAAAPTALHRVGMASRQPPHFLCFAKESKQRKATRRHRPAARGALRCSVWPGKGLKLAPSTGLKQSPLLVPSSPALLAGGHGLFNSARCASPRGQAADAACVAGVAFALGALLNRRAAQDKTDKKGQLFEPCTQGEFEPLPVLAEQRRAALRSRAGAGGHLSFGSFSLAKQRKGTRPSGRNPDAVQRSWKTTSKSNPRRLSGRHPDAVQRSWTQPNKQAAKEVKNQ